MHETMELMVELIPQKVEKLWNEWDVRVMILLSLLLQIVLIFVGRQRKYSSKSWVRIIIWTSYLSANWVATVALGMISSFEMSDDQETSQNPMNSVIMTFWAPFLLVHLGGPNNITAYSLEDNELWLRHLLGLIVQVGGVLYIFLIRSWTEKSQKTFQLSLLAIPMFVVGIIKYGERSWALWSASSGRFKESLPPLMSTESDYKVKDDNTVPGATQLHDANEMLKVFKHIYAGEMVIKDSLERCTAVIRRQLQSLDAFKVIELELELMYDVLYTKASVVYSLKGVILQSISLVCYISTLVVYGFFIDKKLYAPSDIALTYLLCAGAVSLEIYAIFILVFTNQTLCWLSRQTHPLAHKIYLAIASVRAKWSHKKRWSDSMGQFNLLEFCLNESNRSGMIQSWIPLALMEMYSKFQHTTYWKDIPGKMKKLIAEHVDTASHKYRSVVLSWRGDHALKESNCGVEYIIATCETLPFECSIMVWHIATDICYWNHVEKYPDREASNPNSKLKVSKLLSDYMMYILVMCPNMLPKGTGHVLLRETREHAMKYFETLRETISSKVGAPLTKKSASQLMYELRADIKWDAKATVLLQGCLLATKLQQMLETQCDPLTAASSTENQWDMISRVWIEMLCYAATQCDWKEHGQQLRRGGELLTHVCLLMVNAGFTEQIDDNEMVAYDEHTLLAAEQFT